MDTPLKMGESSRGMDKKPFANHNQITQNVKDLLASREVENIFENSDFVYMLNQAGGDRQILAKQLGISPHQLSYVTHSGEGEGLLFYGSTILPCGPLPKEHRTLPYHDHQTVGLKKGG